MPDKNFKSPRIGLFDSGRGGLTVLRAAMEQLPEAEFFYLADRDGHPYGTKSCDEIVERTLLCARELARRGVDLIVIACHTASAYALEKVQAELEIPIIGMIEPSIEVGRGARTVLTTEATARSGLYQRALPGAEVIGCTPLVELAEQGAPAPHQDLNEPVLLACTHFPLLRGAFDAVELIDPAVAVAATLASHLSAQPALL